MDLQMAASNEEKLKEEILSQQSSNRMLAEQLFQLQSEKDSNVDQLENSRKQFVELNEKLSEQHKLLQSQVLCNCIKNTLDIFL